MERFVLSAFADEISPDLNVQMDTLDACGIRYIEMRGVDETGVADFSLQKAREIKQRLDARGFAVSAIGSPIGKIRIEDDFAPHLELFRHVLELSQVFETEYIRMFSFYIPEGGNAADYRGEVFERWGRFIDAAQGYDVTLLHENEHGIYGDTVARAYDIVHTLDTPKVRMTFDHSNFILCGEEAYPNGLTTCIDYIAYMHIKDAIFSEQRVVPAGLGDGRIAESLRFLADRGYQGFLSLEPHLGSFAGLAGFEKHLNLKDLPEGGAGTFMAAYNALRAILDTLS